jgi:hypothetical protein
MRKLLILLKIMLVKTDERGYSKKKLNPYNPLTYVTLVIALLIAFILFGAIGMWKETDIFERNPFTYNN